MKCHPAAADKLARGIARDAETSWVHVLSGGTEIVFTTQASDSTLLKSLPHTPSVSAVSAERLLHAFTVPVRSRKQAPADEPPHELDGVDRKLLEALARNGRASNTDLARIAGASEATVRRRLERLRSSGALVFDVDVPNAALGLLAEARLWLSVELSALERVGKALAKHHELTFVAATTGVTNLTATAACENHEALYMYLTTKLAAVQGVRAVQTAAVSRTLKRLGLGRALE